MLLPVNPCAQVVYVFSLSIVRYLFFGGIAFLVFYLFFKNKTGLTKIQKRWSSVKDYQQEIIYSVITFYIFASVPLVLNHPLINPHTNIYTKLNL